MISGSRSVFLSLVAAFALAGCGGGGSSSVSPGTGGGGTGGTTTGTIAVSPSALQFTTPSAAAQQFTVSSSASGVTAPALDGTTCTVNGQQVVTITGGGGTLPATYTVTPNPALTTAAGAPAGNYGNCTLVFTSGTNTATLPILVGTAASGPATLTAAPTSLSFTATNSAAQTFTVSGSGGTGAGTVSVNGASCAGIATVSGSGGTPPQTFTVTPFGAGGCAVVVVDGEVSTTVPVTVAQVTQPAAVLLTPTSLTFAAGNSAPQNVTVSYTGFVGQITVDQTGCAGIATFSIPNGSLPQTGTVTPVAKGTCAVTFTPSAAAAVTLSITVQS
jgi:hypothetical protein